MSSYSVKRLNRRQFLVGLGGFTLGLPVLTSLWPRSAPARALADAARASAARAAGVPSILWVMAPSCEWLGRAW